MMRETWWRRLEALEKSRRLRSLALESRHIIFVDSDGAELQATIAKGPGNFVCHRRADEELVAFHDRVDDELRAFNPHPRVPPILVFMTSEPCDVPQC